MHKLWRSLAVAAAAAAVLAMVGCGSQPVATVNGGKITKEEFYDRLESTAGRQVLTDLIARKLLDQAFQGANLTLTDEEVAAEIKKVRDRAPDEAAWAGFLKQQGMTEQEFADFVRFQLKVQKLATKDIKVDDATLQKFFQQYRDRFNRPALVTLSEIVLSDQAKADQVRKQLADPKASFAALARTHSMSSFTRERGGRRPEEPLQGLQPEPLRAAVAQLAVGQVSQPIKADGQWYIVKVEEKKPAQKADYQNAEVKEQVREAYLASKAKDVQQIIEEEKNKSSIRILEPRYQELNQLFAPPPSLPSFGEQRPQGAQPQAPAGQAPAPAQPAAPAAGQQPAAPAAPAAPAQ